MSQHSFFVGGCDGALAASLNTVSPPKNESTPIDQGSITDLNPDGCVSRLELRMMQRVGGGNESAQAAIALERRLTSDGTKAGRTQTIAR